MGWYGVAIGWYGIAMGCDGGVMAWVGRAAHDEPWDEGAGGPAACGCAMELALAGPEGRGGHEQAAGGG